MRTFCYFYVLYILLALGAVIGKVSNLNSLFFYAFLFVVIIIIISQLYNRKYSAGRNRTGVLGVNNNPFI